MLISDWRSDVCSSDLVRAADSSDAFRQLAEMLVATSTDRRWGRQMVQNKLADSLFTLAVCEYVRSAQQPRGLLAALTDTRLAKARSEARIAGKECGSTGK